MAVYKVIQDVEAEDKIVGFLTLKSFIYAIIAISLAYINFRFLMAGTLGPLRFVFVLIFLFPMLIFGILAAPLGRDQPTEVWILSHLQFFLKSHRRIWDQSGVQDLVTITAPKKIDHALTKNLSQSEVQSRLKALATTLDSRGWAVRNVAVNLNAYPSYLDVQPNDTDRLVSASSLAQQGPGVDVQESDDIMDVRSNPTAQHFDSLIQEADVKRKEEVLSRVAEARESEPENVQPDYGFLDQVPASDNKDKGSTTFVGRKIISPTTKTANQTMPKPQKTYSNDERGLLERLHDEAEFVRKHTAGFAPKGHEEKKAKSNKKQAPHPSKPTPPNQPTPAVTAKPQNARLKELGNLAEVGKNDRISTLQQMASREKYQVKQIGPGEVEIDLHAKE